ncbi:Fc.00g088850.m01.CDS01 [Cosmosporella sp. VM-42]
MTACHIVIYLFCFITLVFATSTPQLKPLPRSQCLRSDRNIVVRDRCGCPCDGNTNTTLPGSVDVDLKDDEQLLWTSPNGTQTAVMSFTMKPYPGQRVIDMERFSQDIVTVICSEDMSFQFEHVETFERARETWGWVNEDEERAFILVGDPVACKSGNARDPWLVTHATFDPEALVIQLTATKKEWTEVTYEYKIDYGALETNLPKRFLDYDWGEPFEVSLTKPFPESLITFDEGVPGVFETKFFTNCNNCGIFGRLLFEGHIAGNILEGVTRLDLSIVPRDIHVDLNLEVLLSGYYDAENGEADLGKDFDLLDIPLPSSWTVPGILALGPYAKLQAGFALKYFEGNARFATGVSLRVPDDSEFRIDFLADELVTTSGWKPDFEVKPLEVEAEVNAVLDFYLGISPSIDLVLFNQRGLVAGFPFKFLTVDLDVKGGYDPAGFCPNDNKPYGVSVDASLGAELSVQVIERKAGIKLPDLIEIKKGNGKVLLFEPKLKEKIKLNPKHAAARSLQAPEAGRLKRDEVIFETSVFDEDDLLQLPPFCKSFGTAGEPVCRFVPEPEDREWYDTEIADAEEVDMGTKRRSRDFTLHRRAVRKKQATRGTRKFQCDGQKTDVRIKPYPGPSLLVHREEAGKDVPIMVPELRCGDTQCTPDKWTVNQSGSIKDVVIPEDPADSEWSTDHIYEINWVTSFWQHIAEDKEVTCPKVLQDYKVAQGGGYAEEMLHSIGNMDTYKDMMLLYPIIDNGMKHRIFSKSTKNLAAKFYAEKYTANDRACSIGRIISSCKYMEMPETRRRLHNTLNALDAVLANMDNDPNIAHPSEPGGTTLPYTDVHEEWFTDLYHNGTKAARETLIKYATHMIMETPDDFDTLPEKTQTEITKIKNCASEQDCLEFCPDTFKYSSRSSPKATPTPKPGGNRPYNPSDPPSDPTINAGPFWVFKLLADDGRSYSQTPSKLYNLNPALLTHDLGGNGIQTNTECVLVSDTEPGVVGAYLRKGDSFYFGWEKEGDTREFTCFLLVHDNSNCELRDNSEGSELYNPGDATPGTFPFDVVSWQVTNCVEMVRDNTG